jgi:hypothetical protein
MRANQEVSTSTWEDYPHPSGFFARVLSLREHIVIEFIAYSFLVVRLHGARPSQLMQAKASLAPSERISAPRPRAFQADLLTIFGILLPKLAD